MATFFFDFETHLIKRGLVAPRPVAAGHVLDDGKVWIDLRDEGTRDRLADALKLHTIVGHNVAFDLGVSVAEWPELLPLVFTAYEEGRVRDTMIQQMLIDGALGETEFRRAGFLAGATPARYGLADLVRHYFGRELPKADTWRLRYAELDGVPLDEWPDEARSYLVRDVDETRNVYRAQVKTIGSAEWASTCGVKQGELPDVERQHRAAWWLHLMGSWGVRTDRAAVDKLRAGLVVEIEKAGAELVAAGLLVDGVKKLAPCRERVRAWYEAHGRAVPLTDKGAISTDGDAIEATDDPALLAWSRFVSLDKLLGTYVDGRGSNGKPGVGLVHGVDRPICARWNVLVDSGRTSASAPNLQNPPRDGEVRPCVIPRPGRVFIFSDYDTAELRALAQVCLDLFKSSALADAFYRGLDPHRALGAVMLGISYEDAIARKHDPDVKRSRQFAKVPNFGFPGGLGVDAFRDYARGYGFNVSADEARDAKAAWIKTWPEMPRYFDHIAHTIELSDGVIRHHRSGRVRGGLNFTAACNTLFQGMVADGAKHAGWLLAREMYATGSPLSGARSVLFLHDEFGIEVREDRAADAARRVEELMIAGMRRFVPDVPITCSPAITRRWFKGPEAVYVDGVIVPGKSDGNGGWVDDV